MTDYDHYLQLEALELAQDIQSRDHDLVERVDVRNKEVMILPPSGITHAARDVLKEDAETWVQDIPFTFSEWWYDRNDGYLVISPYWITGGQLSQDQLNEYDEFIMEMEEVHG